MQFRVPKFLERESKIAFGLTFKKLGVLGGLALLLFILWYVVPRIVFVFAAVILGGGFAAASFLKIGGQSIPDIAKHSFGFFTSAKIYIWHKKTRAAPIQLAARKRPTKVVEKESPLKVAPESRLGSISSRIEMGGIK